MVKWREKIPQKYLMEEKRKEKRSISDEKAIYLHTIVNLSDIDVDIALLVAYVPKDRKNNNNNKSEKTQNV